MSFIDKQKWLGRIYGTKLYFTTISIGFLGGFISLMMKDQFLLRIYAIVVAFGFIMSTVTKHNFKDLVLILKMSKYKSFDIFISFTVIILLLTLCVGLFNPFDFFELLVLALFTVKGYFIMIMSSKDHANKPNIGLLFIIAPLIIIEYMFTIYIVKQYPISLAFIGIYYVAFIAILCGSLDLVGGNIYE